MSDKPKLVSCIRTVRFQDCDPFNHLNNGRYFDYFMNAREDQLIEHFGIDIYKLAKKTGLSWVVGSTKIAFLRPAFLMERVLIESQTIAYSNKDLLVEMRMYNEDGNQLKCIVWFNFVHYNLSTQKVERHSEEWMKLYEEICLPLKEKSFDERHASLQMLKTQIKAE
jgi:thioesterase-3